MGDAILRIPRDARVLAYRTRDTYNNVVPATSKRQPYCHSSYIMAMVILSSVGAWLQISVRRPFLFVSEVSRVVFTNFER